MVVVCWSVGRAKQKVDQSRKRSLKWSSVSFKGKMGGPSLDIHMYGSQVDLHDILPQLIR
jgi:hypothetical protein